MSWSFEQVCMAHGTFIESGGKQALQQGSVAFVQQLVAARRHGGGGGGSGALPGTATAVGVAALVLCTALGIGVAGILQTRQ